MRVVHVDDNTHVTVKLHAWEAHWLSVVCETGCVPKSADDEAEHSIPGIGRMFGLTAMLARALNETAGQDRGAVTAEVMRRIFETAEPQEYGQADLLAEEVYRLIHTCSPEAGARALQVLRDDDNGVVGEAQP